MLTKRHLRWRVLIVAGGPAGLAACSGGDGSIPVYCYRTLADVGCYEQPDHGREAQLVGVYRWRPSDQASAAAGEATPAPEEERGLIAGALVATTELVGRILTPIGPIISLFR